LLFRRKYKRGLPEGVKLSRRNGAPWVKWPGGQGEVTPDGKHVMVAAATWTARYRDADGAQVERSTGCRDKSAAQARLTGWLSEVEKIRAGVISAADVACSRWDEMLLASHIEDYAEWLHGHGRTAKHILDTKNCIQRIVIGCAWRRLRDLDKTQAERWIASLDMSARRRNGYATAITSFGNYLFRMRRTISNPFAKIHKENVATDRRRIRRALTSAEAIRLIAAAEQRELHTALFENRGKTPAKLSALARDTLLWRGKTRGMAYRLLLVTGLRWAELRSIRLCDVRLEAVPAFVELSAQYEKSRRGAKLPLDRRTVEALRVYMNERRLRLTHGGKVIPLGGLDEVSLFELPQALSRIFRRDLEFAKIPQTDERGHYADLHALRHTFLTWAARSGASLIAVQKLARHTDVKLTAAVYTHLKLSDLAGVVEAMPMLDGHSQGAAQAMGGIDSEGITPDNTHVPLSLSLSPPDGKTGHKMAHSGNSEGVYNRTGESTQVVETPGVMHGSGAGIRTPDTRIMIPLL